MLESLHLPLERDFATLQWLGNTGSAALPSTLAIGLQLGVVEKGHRLGLLGIGSGINSLMLAVEWQKTQVLGEPNERLPAELLAGVRSAVAAPHFSSAAKRTAT